MADKSELQHLPRQAEALDRSETRSSLIARARRDAACLMECTPDNKEKLAVRQLKASILSIGNDAEEQFQLGQNSFSKQAYKDAAFWFSKAAKQGHRRAQGYLGVLYAKGQGVSQNDAISIGHLRLAAEQGDVTSIFNLVLIISSQVASGNQESNIEGFFWASLGAIIDHPSYDDIRDAFASRLRPDEFLEVQGRVDKWLAEHPAKQ